MQKFHKHIAKETKNARRGSCAKLKFTLKKRKALTLNFLLATDHKAVKNEKHTYPAQFNRRNGFTYYYGDSY